MTTPQIPASHHDLLNAPVAALATVGSDGRPQVTAVWFLATDDGVQISLNKDRQKTKNLVANPAVNLFILDPANPMRYLEVRGDAKIVDDPAYAFADRVGQKYGGVDLRNFDAPNSQRVVITIKPVKVNAVAMG